MIIIYSDKEVEGINGVYIAPRFFNVDKLEKGAKCIYTNKKEIAEAYKNASIEVRGFPKALATKES